MTITGVCRELVRIPRRCVRLCQWLLGLRTYPWAQSPLHRDLGRLMRAAKRGNTRLHRLVFVLCAALLKHREQVYANRRNFVARLSGPVSAEVLRNMALWQLGIRRNAEIPLDRKAHGHLCLTRDPETPQLDRLFSLVCLSEVLDDFSVFWDEATAEQHLPLILTRSEQNREASQDGRFDLNQPRRTDIGALEGYEWQWIFAQRFDPRRTATQYVKVAHPRAFVVALSLPEDDDGFCDAALQQWLPHLRHFSQESPGLVFCLLNCATLGLHHADPNPPGIAPVRCLGFGLADAIALARGANAFLGCLDAFGLAAIGARRPGVYLDPTGKELHEPERGTWVLTDPSPERALNALRTVIRQAGPGGISSGQPAIPVAWRDEGQA